MIGERVGPFEIVESLGRGRHTAVYRAVRHDERRAAAPVELHVLDAGPDGPDAAAWEALRRRYAILGEVQDPRVPPAVALYAGHGALALAWVRAAPLSDILTLVRAGRLDLDVATTIDLLVEVAYALRRMHALARDDGPVAHGSLSAEVVALASDGAVIVRGVADGDPAHAWPTAPELGHAAPDARTDQWLLGALALELLRHAPELLDATRGAPVEHAFARVQARWPAAARILTRALSEDPTQRYEGDDRLLKDLLAFGRSLGAPSRRAEVGAKAVQLHAGGALAAARAAESAGEPPWTELVTGDDDGDEGLGRGLRPRNAPVGGPAGPPNPPDAGRAAAGGQLGATGSGGGPRIGRAPGPWSGEGGLAAPVDPYAVWPARAPEPERAEAARATGTGGPRPGPSRGGAAPTGPTFGARGGEGVDLGAAPRAAAVEGRARAIREPAARAVPVHAPRPLEDLDAAGRAAGPVRTAADATHASGPGSDPVKAWTRPTVALPPAPRPLGDDPAGWARPDPLLDAPGVRASPAPDPSAWSRPSGAAPSAAAAPTTPGGAATRGDPAAEAAREAAGPPGTAATPRALDAAPPDPAEPPWGDEGGEKTFEFPPDDEPTRPGADAGVEGAERPAAPSADAPGGYGSPEVRPETESRWSARPPAALRLDARLFDTIVEIPEDPASRSGDAGGPPGAAAVRVPVGSGAGAAVARVAAAPPAIDAPSAATPVWVSESGDDADPRIDARGVAPLRLALPAAGPPPRLRVSVGATVPDGADPAGEAIEAFEAEETDFFDSTSEAATAAPRAAPVHMLAPRVATGPAASVGAEAPHRAVEDDLPDPDDVPRVRPVRVPPADPIPDAWVLASVVVFGVVSVFAVAWRLA